MDHKTNLFQLFNGIRPMARALGEAPANVSAWKKKGRIPAEKQPHVLEVGQTLGLPITAEHVVFPLGRPDAATPVDLAAEPTAVACDRNLEPQRKDIH
jgi:hypothetical protein